GERLPGLSPSAEPRLLDRDIAPTGEVVRRPGANVDGEASWLQEPPNVELGFGALADRRSTSRGERAGNASPPTPYTAPGEADRLDLADMLILSGDAPVQRDSSGLHDAPVDHRCRPRSVVTQGEGKLAGGVAVYAAQVVFALLFLGAFTLPALEILGCRRNEGNDVRWEPVCG